MSSRLRRAQARRVVQFQVAFDDGRQVRFWNRIVSGTGINPVGRVVDVVVNPDHPTDAVVVKGALGPSPPQWRSWRSVSWPVAGTNAARRAVR
jgi:hypothetical protein